MRCLAAPWSQGLEGPSRGNAERQHDKPNLRSVTLPLGEAGVKVCTGRHVDAVRAAGSLPTWTMV
eukprot:366318-Chlamydomonas_euryale.AAC.7